MTAANMIAMILAVLGNMGMDMPVRAAAGHCEPVRLPMAAMDSTLDTRFAGQLGPGWIGGDSSYSTILPDGREVFVFSDTFIGMAKPDGTATLTGMPHNTELLGTTALQSHYAGTYHKPEALIPDGHQGNWFWAFSTYSEGGAQLIYVNEFNHQNMFGQFTGVSGIATMKVTPGGMPRFSKLTRLPYDPDTLWGLAVTDDPTYHYIYGRSLSSTTHQFNGMKLARVPRGYSTVLAQWQYWDGKDWVNNALAAVPIPTGNELDGVMPQPDRMGKGYLAVSIPNGVFSDTTLDVSFACSPQGSWSKPVALYTLPEITGRTAYKNEIAYLPTVHPELDGARDIVASYNINTTDGLAAYGRNIHIYQPRFLRLRY